MSYVTSGVRCWVLDNGSVLLVPHDFQYVTVGQPSQQAMLADSYVKMLRDRADAIEAASRDVVVRRAVFKPAVQK